MQLSHYPHHPIRAGKYQKMFLNIWYFAHALQAPKGWVGENIRVSQVFVPSETDPLRDKFYASSIFIHFLPKPDSSTLSKQNKTKIKYKVKSIKKKKRKLANKIKICKLK
jgi:hypothetical protein